MENAAFFNPPFGGVNNAVGNDSPSRTDGETTRPLFGFVRGTDDQSSKSGYDIGVAAGNDVERAEAVDDIDVSGGGDNIGVGGGGDDIGVGGGDDIGVGGGGTGVG